MRCSAALLLSAALVVCSPCLRSASLSAGELSVATNFEGGSGVVEEIDQESRTIRLRPTPHKERGWICWWYFHVTGAKPGETLTLDIGGGVWATPDQAFFSVDNKTWQQLPPGQRLEKDRIVYKAVVPAEEAWFAWGPPFVPSDAEALVTRLAESSPYATAFELCKTRGGRSTPALRVSQPGVPDEERLGIWVQARQHAWESGSSWVGKGFIEWLLSDDERAETLRKKALVTFVPIKDLDNTAIGAGGKNQVPQDHNRDWSDEPHWRAVAEAQLQIRKLDSDGRFDLFIDLHNPGARDLQPFYFAAPKEILSPRGQRNLESFVAASREEITGPLKLSEKVRESGAGYDRNWKNISKNWVTFQCRDHVVAVTLETSWNTPHSTPAGYQQVGRQLGRSIERYFRGDVRAE